MEDGNLNQEDLDRADEEILNGVQLLSTKLTSYAKSLEDLKTERETYVRHITDLEKEASAVGADLSKIKEEILLVREEVDQYNNYVAQKVEEVKNIYQRKEQEKVDIKVKIEDGDKKIWSLEEDIEKLRTSRFSPLHQDPYVQALLPVIAGKKSEDERAELLSQYKSQKEDAPSLLEHHEYEPSIKIDELLGLEQVPVVDDAYKNITTGLNIVFSGIVSSLKKVFDYYDAEDKIGEEVKRLARENKEYEENMREKDSLIPSAQEEIKQYRERCIERESYLKNLAEKDDPLKAKIEEYNKQIACTKEQLEGNIAMRKELIKEFISTSIKSVLPDNDTAKGSQEVR